MFDFEELDSTEPAAVNTAELSPGDLVRLKGLVGAQHLNGETGLLERLDEATGRWDVKLVGGDVKSIKIGNLERKEVVLNESALLIPGARVRLQGLSAAHLNGLEGNLDGFDIHAGRWEVKLLGGQVKAIKPSNLVRQRPLDNRVVIESKEQEVRVCTWNLLAACWHAGRGHVSEARTDFWQPRLKTQLAAILGDTFPDILCLQEVYFSAKALRIVEEAAKEQGYEMFALQRTNGKPDGLAILVKTNRFEAVAREEQQLCFIGSRVALWLLLKPKFNLGMHALVVGTTHFTFPHSMHDLNLRQQQGEKARSGCKTFAKSNGLDVDNTCFVLAGDLNCEPESGNTDETLAEFTRDGWRSSFAESCGHEAGATHRTHNDESTCADFVLVRGALHATASTLLPATVADTVDMPRPEVGGANLLSLTNPPRTLADWSQLSDHRPLVTTLSLQESTTVPDTVIGS